MSIKSAKWTARPGVWQSLGTAEDLKIVATTPMFHHLIATARISSAEVRVDEQGVPTFARVEIAANSLIGATANLTARIASQPILDSAKFPLIVFESNSFQPLVEGFKVSGVLQIKDRSIKKDLSIRKLTWSGIEALIIKGHVDLMAAEVGIGLIKRRFLANTLRIEFTTTLEFLANQSSHDSRHKLN
ncbi:MAG: YceI family protein [Acidimicrobiaceae bacterium]|nr:YceI family protein [Acidimicrobiaceae bacterium]